MNNGNGLFIGMILGTAIMLYVLLNFFWIPDIKRNQQTIIEQNGRLLCYYIQERQSAMEWKTECNKLWRVQ